MSDRKLPQRTSRLEWATAAVGAAVIATMVGYLIYHGITHPPSPPDIIVTANPPEAIGQGYLVEFSAFNKGNTTAANLTIEGSISDRSGVVETSEVTLDYLPQQASRKGGLIFSKDPERYDLTLRASGFSAP